MNIKTLLKDILKVTGKAAEESADQFIPGASLIINGIHDLVDKDSSNNTAAILGMQSGIITALTSLNDGKQVADVALLNQGIMEIGDGFDKVRAALKKKNG